MTDGRPRDVLVLRALHLGDVLRAIPAFRAMRSAWPDARIRLIGLPWSRALVPRLPGYLDDVVAFPGWPGVPETRFEAARTLGFLSAASRTPADLAIQMHGSGVQTNAFVALLGAKRTAGTFVPGTHRPDPATYVPLDERASEVRRCLAVLEPLGVRPAGEHLELRVLDADRRAADALLDRVAASATLRAGFAVVHAGGRSARRWPAARFAAVADDLARDLPVVLTGTADERDVAAEIIARMRRPAIDLVGTTPMGAMFALVDRARVVVCNDTGISHVADALDVPSVVLFTSSDPSRWAPTDRPLHRALAGDAVDPRDVARHARDAARDRPDPGAEAASVPVSRRRGSAR